VKRGEEGGGDGKEFASWSFSLLLSENTDAAAPLVVW